MQKHQQVVMHVCFFAVAETNNTLVKFLFCILVPCNAFPSQCEQVKAPGTAAEIKSKDVIYFENCLHYCLATKLVIEEMKMDNLGWKKMESVK